MKLNTDLKIFYNQFFNSLKENEIIFGLSKTVL